jgi:glycosyltransferase involved in cell wall biosynthesis
MHILMVADGRSPIALRWKETIRALGHRVTLISTFACQKPEGIDEMFVLPVAFSNVVTGSPGTTGKPNNRRRWVSALRGMFLYARYYLGPLSVLLYAQRYRKLVEEIKPDLVHALRIPYEGMLASYTPSGVPLAISIWGNDLTLHATRSRWMKALTRQTLLRTDGLHTDAQRDMRLAYQWGYPEHKPSLLVPSNGGIDLNLLNAIDDALRPELEAQIQPETAMVINPRGVRAYTCTDTFFQAIPLVLERRPQTTFLCPGMAGESEATKWFQRLRLDERTLLLPGLTQAQLWGLFRRSRVSVSVTTHDGTPNTLLEAMGCGSFPVAGDLESLREWIVPGVNGLLVEADKPQGLAEAIVTALDNPDLCEKAADYNIKQILARAEVNQVRPQLEVFYQRVSGLQ